MKIKKLVIFIFCISSIIAAQTNTEFGKLFIIESSYAPFPHENRYNGYNYGDSLYNFFEHYNDSSVAVFIPNGFKKLDNIDLVFYFHGWNNNIKKSIDKFELAKQFNEANKNAIFVFPEGPKNSPDSFGGKLEEEGVFKNLVDEIIKFLIEENIINNKAVGNIILSGHSGAYRVISYILNGGGLTNNISEVYLFDALYGKFEKYAIWIDRYNGRFINIITPKGGTFNNSLKMLKDFDNWGIEYLNIKGNKISDQELKDNRIVFLFTDLGHSEVINPYLKQLLRTSKLNNKL